MIRRLRIKQLSSCEDAIGLTNENLIEHGDHMIDNGLILAKKFLARKNYVRKHIHI